MPYESDEIENEVFVSKTKDVDTYVTKLSKYNRHQERMKFCYDSYSHFSTFIEDYLKPLFDY